MMNIKDYIEEIFESPTSLKNNFCHSSFIYHNEFCDNQLGGTSPIAFFNNYLDPYFSNYSIESLKGQQLISAVISVKSPNEGEVNRVKLIFRFENNVLVLEEFRFLHY